MTYELHGEFITLASNISDFISFKIIIIKLGDLIFKVFSKNHLQFMYISGPLTNAYSNQNVKNFLHSTTASLQTIIQYIFKFIYKTIWLNRRILQYNLYILALFLSYENKMK